uniref:Uncharacterized protein n=1 Tax=Oryza brachyantha TaxID=4533 RepID=J3L052_ORYBR
MAGLAPISSTSLLRGPSPSCAARPAPSLPSAAPTPSPLSDAGPLSSLPCDTAGVVSLVHRDVITARRGLRRLSCSVPRHQPVSVKGRNKRPSRMSHL